MIENCPEADIQLDALRLSSAPKLRSAECYCSRATLDELLSDAVMAPVLRSAGHEPGEFPRNDDGDGLECRDAVRGR